jgi:hypothetical protein
MMVQTPALPAGNRVDIIVANSQGSCEIERVFSVQPCPSVSISSVDPSSGREIGGEVVAIRGSNLDLGGTVQVFFGAVEAEVRFQSTPQVRVTAPPGTGTVDVRVVTGCGEAVRIGGYTYVPCGPALTSLSPLSGREPGGIAVTLIGSNFDVGTTTVTFGGVPATVMSVTSTEIEVINPAGSGPVQVVVETDCGPSNVRFFTYNACNPVTITLVEPATGAESGDTHVHVRGGGLHQDSVQEVLFGGVPATIVRRPSGQVIVRTPPGIGTVDVSVRNDCDTVVAAGAYTYLPDEIAARLGNVNVDDGDRADVLLVNSSAGDGNRVVQVNIGEPIALEILAPPSRSVAKYAVWGFAGTPTAGTVFSSPFDLGLFAFAPPFGGGAPVVVWNTIGRRPLLGTPDFASPDAPATLFTHPGLNHGVTVTFLGLVRDDAARIPEGFASANAVVLEVQ